MTSEQRAAYMQVFSQCSASAQQAHLEADPLRSFAATLPDVYEELNDRILSHQRLLDFDEAVRRCVAERGYTYDRDKLWNDFGVESQRLHEQASARPSPQLNSQERSELAELQRKEIGLATAVYECGGGAIERRTLTNEIRTEVETAYISENQAVLEPFRHGS